MTRGSALFLACTAAVISAGAGGCVDAPEFYYGEPVGELDKLTLYDTTVGIYPSQSVLSDPNNPFAGKESAGEERWRIEAGAGPVAAFYSWATLNARQPTGEHQYYTALNLRKVYATGAAVEEDLSDVGDLAIRGFQAVLDYFPDSVTYNDTGDIAYDLATPSYRAIIDLGGKVKGGWILVQTAEGQARAVRP